jgi:hypothetical protein
VDASTIVAARPRPRTASDAASITYDPLGGGGSQIVFTPDAAPE